MVKKKDKSTTSRGRLNPERVIKGAVLLADEIGLEGFTIRRLAESIDAKPMTIYHHVPNKDSILDGMVDLVFSEIDLPPKELHWRAAIEVRCRSMRQVLALHPWASAIMESRTQPGSATLRHHDAVLGCFREAGFSLKLTGHAYASLDAFIYGYALQEATLPATAGEDFAEVANVMAERMPADEYPHLTEFTYEHVLQPQYDFRKEFEVGLGYILDGLEGALARVP